MIRHGWELALRGFGIVTSMHYVDRASRVCRSVVDGSNAAAASWPTGDSNFSTGSASTAQRRAAYASQTYREGA